MSTSRRFLPLTGIHEPSAVQQLPDGRFLVAEDEAENPFSILTIAGDGRITREPLYEDRQNPGACLPKLDDLEGLTGDAAGVVYAITSHSRDGDGNTRNARERLVRFRIDGNRVVSPVVVGDLKPALTLIHPVLAESANVRNVKEDGGFNIEAIEATPDGAQLLVGFRSPLRNGQALVAAIENPEGAFDDGKPPRVSPRLFELDLGGNGLRSLAFVPALDAYLIVGGPVARQEAQFHLWLWDGTRSGLPRRVTVPGLDGFEHAEGICAARLGGEERILIVSDDGDRKKGRCASYLLLDPAELCVGS